MIELRPVGEEDREFLWNVNQKYLYEMTRFYDDPMDEKGNYHYGHFDEYFTDPERRAFFLLHEGKPVGFAMLCPYSNIGRDPDCVMAEFTVFPAYRRRHFALEAARRILDRYRGGWEIKYNEKNAAAGKLWNLVAAPYRPETVRLNEEETVLVFSNRIRIS